MKKLMLIVNPKAGKATIKAQIYSIMDKFYKAGYVSSLFPTDKNTGATKIVAEHADGFDLIVCCGGDGTLSQVVSELHKQKLRIPIGYIPCGTANDVASSLVLPSNALSAASDIVDGVSVPIDIGTLGGRNFVYIACFGAFTEASYSTPQEQKNLLGHLAYVLNGIKSLQSIKSFHMKIEVGGEVLEDDYIFGAMINSLSFAGLFKMDKDIVRFNDGVFELVLIKTPYTLIDLQNTASCLLRRQYDNEYISLVHTSRAVISCDEDVAFTLDGEFGGNHRNAVLSVQTHAADLVLRKDSPALYLFDK
jgi:YegS/Rv2252/BmrU family lipid kinase